MSPASRSAEVQGTIAKSRGLEGLEARGLSYTHTPAVRSSSMVGSRIAGSNVRPMRRAVCSSFDLPPYVRQRGGLYWRSSGERAAGSQEDSRRQRIRTAVPKSGMLSVIFVTGTHAQPCCLLVWRLGRQARKRKPLSVRR